MSVLVPMAERAQLEAWFPDGSYEPPFQVTDIKQWVYCQRILYYHLCLPDIRPTTYKMEAGVEASQAEEGREARRSLKTYGVTSGRREFNLRLDSTRMGLRGIVDMVIWLDETQRLEAIPVDFKFSRIAGEHFKLQLAAYGLMLEEAFGCLVKRGYLYSIPDRRATAVSLTPSLRRKVANTLEAMHRMLWTERLPEPTPRRARCVDCEFRRFCNDVL